MTLQIVVSLIDATRGVIYDCHMFIVQAIGLKFCVIFFAINSSEATNTVLRTYLKNDIVDTYQGYQILILKCSIPSQIL